MYLFQGWAIEVGYRRNRPKIFENLPGHTDHEFQFSGFMVGEGVSVL